MRFYGVLKSMSCTFVGHIQGCSKHCSLILLYEITYAVTGSWVNIILVIPAEHQYYYQVFTSLFLEYPVKSHFAVYVYSLMCHAWELASDALKWAKVQHDTCMYICLAHVMQIVRGLDKWGLGRAKSCLYGEMEIRWNPALRQLHFSVPTLSPYPCID